MARAPLRVRASALSGFEIERRAIHAIAEAGWSGTVVEHVTKMRTARRAQCFGADHAVGTVDLGGDRVVGHRIEEARPSRAAVELRVAAEELGVAHDAVVGAVVVAVPVLAGEGSFGGAALGHLELLGAQALAQGLFPGGGIGGE